MQNVIGNVSFDYGMREKYGTNLSVEKVKNYYRQYTYDDPTSYKGPILESWPPSKSRWIVPDMNEHFTSIPWRFRFENKTLIAIVQSTPSETKLRDVWRKTWVKNANNQTSV